MNIVKKIGSLIKVVSVRMNNNGGRIDIIKNTGWLFVDKIGRQGLNFLLTAWIARYLGTDQFGLWNYAIAFVGLFSFFSTLGLFNLLLRDFIKQPENRDQLLGSAFIAKLIGGVVTLLLSSLTIFFLKPENGYIQGLIILVACGYLIQSLDVIDYYFQSQLKAKWIMITRAISFMLMSSLKVYFILFKYPLESFLYAQVGELAISAGVLAFVFQKNVGKILNWNISWTLVRSLITQSFPIMLSEVAIIIYMRIDQVMVGDIRGDYELGIYSAAVRLSEVWYFIPGIICSSFFPSIIRSHYISITEYQYKLQRLYDVLVWISLVIGLIVAISAPLLMNIIFGEEFAGSSAILVIHIWSSVFVFIGFASNQQLVVENKMNISLYRTLLGMVINITLNLILIPIWGGMGAAIATLVAQACSSWFSSIFFAETRIMFWMPLHSLSLARLYRNLKPKKVV